MVRVQKHPPGSFCWFELLATDLTQAREFYSKFFEWEIQEDPIGEGVVYVRMQKEGVDVAAMYQMSEVQKKDGLKPGWLSYISVEDVDSTTERALQSGANAIYRSVDVFTAGRLSLLRDPVGALFALWEPKEHHGVGRVAEHGCFCWNELVIDKVEIPEAFYTGVFGWKTMTADMGEMRYTSFILDDKPIAGMYEKGEPEKKSPNHWRIYFAVDNCDEMAEKASSLGAKMVMPPMDIPDVGRMSIILDPQGGEFAIIKLLQNE